MNKALMVLTLLVGASAAAFGQHVPPDADAVTEGRAHHAMLLSAEGTALSVGAIAGGLALTQSTNSIVGAIGAAGVLGGVIGFITTPSWGHVYGESRLWTPGMYTRIAGVGVMLTGLIVQLHDTKLCLDGPCGAQNYTGLGIVGTGAVTIAGGAIYDIVTAGDATRRFIRRQSALSMVPTAITTPDHRVVGGFGIGGAF
jgi:hypothetical protein